MQVLGQPAVALYKCEQCGVDAACNCGAPLVPAWKKAQEFEEANPGMSSRDVADAIGVDQKTVINARKKRGEERSSAEDDRPTIDKPPRGPEWDQSSML